MTPAERREWATGMMRRIPRRPQSDAPTPRPAAQSATHSATAASASPQSGRSSPARPRRPRTPPAPVKASLADSVAALRSVNKSHLPMLERLGISTVQDLLYQFPLRHLDYANIRKVNELVPGEEQTTVATLWEARVVGQNPRRKSTQAVFGDDTGNLHVVWFNNPVCRKEPQAGRQGCSERKGGRLWGVARGSKTRTTTFCERATIRYIRGAWCRCTR